MRAEQQREEPVVARALDHDPHRPEPVAEPPHALLERPERPQRPRRHLDREAEAVRHLRRPALELLLGRQPVARSSSARRTGAAPRRRRGTPRARARPDRSPVARRGTTSPTSRPIRHSVRGRASLDSPMAVTTEVIPDSSIPVLDHGFVRLDAAMADDLSVVNAARVSFARAPRRGRRCRRRPDPLPDARPARDALRAQLLPLPHPLPDLRRARVVPAPDRLLQRVLDAVREGDRRLLRARGRGRAQPGGQAGLLLVRARRSRARRAHARGARRRSTTSPTPPTRGSSRKASRGSSRGRCCRSAPTPSSTGRSTPGR